MWAMGKGIGLEAGAGAFGAFGSEFAARTAFTSEETRGFLRRHVAFVSF